MEPISLAALAVALAAYGGVKLVLHQRNHRLLTPSPRQTHDPARWRHQRWRQPAQQVAEARPGLVRLSGISQRLRQLTAPFSGRQVIGYALTLTGLYREGARLALFPTLTYLEDFYLSDASGSALVRADGARLLFTHFNEPRELGLPPEGLTRALAAEGYDLNDYHDHTQLQVFEQLILDNEQLAVSGEATLEVDARGAAAGLRSAPQLLVVRGSKKTPLLVATCSHEQLRENRPLTDLLPIARKP